MFFLKIKPFFRGYEVTGLRRLQGYEIAKSSIYLATTGLFGAVRTLETIPVTKISNRNN